MGDLSQIEAEMARYRAESAEHVAQLAAARWVRVMCDYSADGVWSKGGGSFDCTALPITPQLVWRIRQWQVDYERSGYWTGEFGLEGGLEAFAETGLHIAIEMKRQLPDWTIVYSDARRRAPEASATELSDIRATLIEGDDLERALEAAQLYTDRFRAWFEYEITSDVVESGTPPDNYPK